MEKQNQDNFKSGFITMLGRTNVGKSSIINALLGEKVAAIANKPQTTRTAIRAILNRPNSQIVFLDTPGIHKPKSKLGNTMVETAFSALDGIDIVLFVIDSTSKDIGKGDMLILEKIKELKKKTILVLNKIDLTTKEHIAELIKLYSSEYDFCSVVPISVLTKTNLDVLVEEIENNLDKRSCIL